VSAARKDLFSRALAAAPGRLHMAAHSHHLWPDVTLAAQIQAWEDAAVLADHKWDKALGQVYPAAQGLVARELALPSPDSVVFAPNTHTLLAVLKSAIDRRCIRVLSTDGEFHSFRRQSQRWVETGEAELTLVESGAPDFAERFLATAREGRFDLIFVSQVFFKSGLVFDRLEALADLARPEGPWVVIDGYHGFRAVPTDSRGGGRPAVLHRRRLQVRHGRRRGGVPARAAGLWPAPGPDRLVRRVR
jgi:selenocysteine lyase/cysteine desulfurase